MATHDEVYGLPVLTVSPCPSVVGVRVSARVPGALSVYLCRSMFPLYFQADQPGTTKVLRVKVISSSNLAKKDIFGARYVRSLCTQSHDGWT
jgi:hypothetical protein